jgi:EF-hand domain pair
MPVDVPGILQEGFAMNIRAAVLAALLACGFSLPATADESPGCQRPQLKEAEGNADGGITAEKHAASAAKRFEMMDKDRNGKITRDEIEASHGAESIVWANHPESDVQKIRDLDTNHDGVLSVKEYSAGSQRMFDILDVDGNGVLTPEEMVLDPRSR